MYAPSACIAGSIWIRDAFPASWGFSRYPGECDLCGHAGVVPGKANGKLLWRDFRRSGQKILSDYGNRQEILCGSVGAMAYIKESVERAGGGVRNSPLKE